MGLWEKEMDLSHKLIEEIRTIFKHTEAKKLLRPEWRKKNLESQIDSTGFCYIAAEVLFHLMGGLESGFFPMVGRRGEITHWWLQNKAGKILDPTHDQFKEKFPYNTGRKACFLTGYTRPSKKSIVLMGLLHK